jgi:hypothetical protein
MQGDVGVVVNRGVFFKDISMIYDSEVILCMGDNKGNLLDAMAAAETPIRRLSPNFSWGWI